jgi:hypothetical protein
MLHAALFYATLGLRVIPLHEPTARGCSCHLGGDCASVGKHPRVTWPAGQVVDEPRVRWSWRRWPTANIGIVCDRLLVLDVDTRHGGGHSLELLERRYGGLPATAVVRTGSLGLHIYFAHPGERIGPSAGKLGAGLDVRADRGIIVVPPSLHASGRRYEWLQGDIEHLAPTPDWLVRALLPPPPKPVRPLMLGSSTSRYVAVALERAAAQVRAASDGAKHDVLWRQAFALGTLVGAGLVDEATVERVLFESAAPRAKSERAALSTIRRNVARGRQCPRRVAS